MNLNPQLRPYKSEKYLSFLNGDSPSSFSSSCVFLYLVTAQNGQARRNRPRGIAVLVAPKINKVWVAVAGLPKAQQSTPQATMIGTLSNLMLLPQKMIEKSYLLSLVPLLVPNFVNMIISCFFLQFFHTSFDSSLRS